jgi:Ca-activated chloride channel family protein
MFGDAHGSCNTDGTARGDRGADQIAALKRVQPVVTQAPSTVTLPRTATDAELKMIAGVILLTLSLILLVFNRRQMSPR